MRFVLLLVLGLSACKGSSKQAGPLVNEADWKPIEALATTPPASGASTDLSRALEIAKTNADAWRDHVHDQPPSDLAAFPQAADAIAALKAWAAAKGGLPPARSPIQIGVVTLDMFSVGQVAIATAKTADDLAPAEYLATTLYTTGRSLLDAQIGTSLAEDAATKRKSLGLPPATLPKVDLVRILAAEAVTSRARNEYASTAAGRQELEAAAKEMPAHEDKAWTAADLIPSDAERKARLAFWVAALQGAQRGESTETTLARLQSATDTAPKAVKDKLATVPMVAKSIVASAAKAGL
jgi:hypothetical protein